MSLYINTNVAAIHGRNGLNSINSQLDVTYQRLSSGLRINSAKDDAAGLAISDRMTSQINGLTQGNRNAADGIALLQTMEGGFEEATNVLQKMRTLAVQAANGTNTQEDRDALSAESQQLADALFDITFKTKYGGKTILAGERALVNNVNPGLGEKDGDSLDGLGNFFKGADPMRKTKITLQVGANGGDLVSFQVGLCLLSALAGKGGIATIDNTGNGPVADCGLIKAAGSAICNLDFSSTENAGKAIGIVDAALKAVDEERANIGSTINRLDATIRNQSNVIANQSDARSRIRDTDFAEESAKLSQQNILQQASMSMLMQANARPQMALSLLG